MDRTKANKEEESGQRRAFLPETPIAPDPHAAAGVGQITLKSQSAVDDRFAGANVVSN